MSAAALDRPRSAAADHRLGVLMQIGSAVAFSLAGFFTRLIAMDAPTLLFWRGLGSAAALAAITAWLHRGRLRATLRQGAGWGLVVAALTAICMTMFLWSLRLSSVAEVSIIYSTIPLVTAVLGWSLLGEPAGWRMLTACAATAIGASVMVGGALGDGHLLGDVVAIIMTLFSGLLFVVLRWRRDVPMLPPMVLAALLAVVAAAPFATFHGVGSADIAFDLLFGVVQNGVGVALMVLGMRRVTATESALYATLDAPLAPFWVWAAFAETPTLSTLCGGALVMAAVALYLATSHARV